MTERSGSEATVKEQRVMTARQEIAPFRAFVRRAHKNARFARAALLITAGRPKHIGVCPLPTPSK
jgi:hypothetical protein